MPHMSGATALSFSSGPVPKKSLHDRPRRISDVAVEILPASGRQGPPPAWPLEGQFMSEPELWAELWKLPHAVVWEKLHLTRLVARYCRILVEAECGGTKRSVEGDEETFVESRAITAARQAAQNLEDRLGLNPLSMRRLQWEVEAPAAAEEKKGADDVRTRLQLMAKGK